jgi:hypothetical protein
MSDKMKKVDITKIKLRVSDIPYSVIFLHWR